MPPYAARIVWLPGDRLVVVSVAVPLADRTTVPRFCWPSRKETLPSAITELDVTTAERVTGLPYVPAVCVATSVVAVVRGAAATWIGVLADAPEPLLSTASQVTVIVPGPTPVKASVAESPLCKSCPAVAEKRMVVGVELACTSAAVMVVASPEITRAGLAEQVIAVGRVTAVEAAAPATAGNLTPALPHPEIATLRLVRNETRTAA